MTRPKCKNKKLKLKVCIICRTSSGQSHRHWDHATSRDATCRGETRGQSRESTCTGKKILKICRIPPHIAHLLLIMSFCTTDCKKKFPENRRAPYIARGTGQISIFGRPSETRRRGQNSYVYTHTYVSFFVCHSDDIYITYELWLV